MKLLKKHWFFLILLIIPFLMMDVFAEPTLKNSDYSIEVFVDGLTFPTTMGFLEKDIVILEKNSGKVRLVQNGILQETPLLDFNVDGFLSGETGLLGILVDKDQVFIYVTETTVDGGKQIANRIYQYTWNENSLINQKIIHEFPRSLGMSHVGGVMTKNVEDEIFVIVGDMDSRNYKLDGPTQNSETNSLRDTGIILKVVKDGTVLKPIESRNPTNYYYAIGIRNSFGITVDPVTNKIWDTENGSWNSDEINLVEKKFNSGWQKIMGVATQSQIESLIKFKDFEYSDPEFTWKKTVAPTALVFFNSEKFPTHKNNLLVADCINGNIYEFVLNSARDGFIFENEGLQDKILNNEDSMKEIIFGTGFGCITDLKVGSDGMLYIVSLTEGKIFRVIPIKENEKNKDVLRPFADLTNRKWEFKNFVGANLRFANFTDSNLMGANFSKADLLNVEFNNVDLSNADFSGADLKQAIFNNANLKNSNFINSNLFGTYFGYSNLENSNLNGAGMKSSNVTYSNFSNANLEDVDFREADLSNADFSGANLKNADLAHSDLSYADLSNADLSGLYYYNTDITGVITNEDTIVDGCFGQDLWNRGLSMIYLKVSQNENIISEIIKSTIPYFCI